MKHNQLALEIVQFLDLVPVFFKKVDSAILRTISLQWLRQLVALVIPTHWIEIYQIDSTIHLFNNWSAILS